MTPEEFSKKFPYLYHMAEANTWESICKHGLLSTSALLDLFEVTGDERLKIESEHRPESVEINHPIHGLAVIRDQKPMSDRSLERCLIELNPRQWYETLNRKVFFWVTQERLFRLLRARAYKDRAHCVLTISTSGLFKHYIEKITLSPINSGCTFPAGAKRGRQTFLPFEQYPFSERRKKNPETVVEVVVDYSVPDIAKYVIRVDHMLGSKILETLYESKI